MLYHLSTISLQVIINSISIIVLRQKLAGSKLRPVGVLFRITYFVYYYYYVNHLLICQGLKQCFRHSEITFAAYLCRKFVCFHYAFIVYSSQTPSMCFSSSS